MRSLCVLGSTGSIGVNTLDVVARHPDRFRISALSANRNIELLATQCAQFAPQYVVVADKQYAGGLRQKLSDAGVTGMEILAGQEGLEQISAAPEVDTVMAAIVGAAGLLPTLAAARHGKRVLLANKEALVMSGRILLRDVADNSAELLPIDSEHNAIFQCMPAGYRTGAPISEVRRILLTASGGPFRTRPLDEFDQITPEQAVAHPNWVMGRKISVDSATMMNKGLELIEACLLFDVTPDRIEVVLHPQSVIHSMVDYLDGSVLAQLGNPDMRTPIAHALSWPERIDSGVEPLNMFEVKKLDFEPPDDARFPCLKLAREAIQEGGNLPAVLNAANEVAVAAFLDGRIRFTDIERIISATLEDAEKTPGDTLDEVLESDSCAREIAESFILNKLSN